VNVSRDTERRWNVIHLYGTKMLNDVWDTTSALTYFTDFTPTTVEWLSDSRCNVVLPDQETAKRALSNLSRPMPVESAGLAPTQALEAGIASEDLPFVAWRLAKTHNPDSTLMMRIATTADVKPTEKKLSKYYQKCLELYKQRKEKEKKSIKGETILLEGGKKLTLVKKVDRIRKGGRGGKGRTKSQRRDRAFVTDFDLERGQGPGISVTVTQSDDGLGLTEKKKIRKKTKQRIRRRKEKLKNRRENRNKSNSDDIVPSETSRPKSLSPSSPSFSPPSSSSPPSPSPSTTLSSPSSPSNNNNNNSNNNSKRVDGVQKTGVEDEELEKRKARGKRFGLTTNS